MEYTSLPIYEKLSRAALALPGAYEKILHGTHAFYIEKKFFVRLKEDGKTIALYNADRDEWIARNGDTFFITSHYEAYSMLLVDMESVSEEDLNKLTEVSWRIRAPKRMLKAYDKNQK